MKTLITAILVVLFSVVAFGQQNPDITESMEIMLHQNFNHYKYGERYVKNNPSGITVKFTKPLNTNISFVLGCGYFTEKSEYRGLDIDRDTQSIYINAGIKIYHWKNRNDQTSQNKDFRIQRR